MLIRRLPDCAPFVAGDGTFLRELLHPDRQEGGFRYSLAHARLAPGTSSLPHALRTSEVYYILQGAGRMHVGDETAEVGVGDAVVIPPGALQYIEAVGPEELAFLCIVDPAWRAEDETVVPAPD